jgi:hypothetical protein
MHTILRLLGNDELAVQRAVQIIATMKATRRKAADAALLALALCTLTFNVALLIDIAGAGQ